MSASTMFGVGPAGGPPAGEFNFLPMEKVRFGPGAVEELAAEVDRLGAERVLLVTGTTLATKTDLVDRVGGVLGDRLAAVYSDTSAHVPRATVAAAAAAARGAHADCLVSFGGSSPCDTAKLVALLLAAGVEDEGGMDALHFREVHGELEFPELPEVTMPHIAISTTLSAGEFTLWGGATDTDRGVKDAYGAPGMTPRVVILDPELSRETPPTLWGSTGLKALDHAVETVSSLKPQPFADALALRAIEMLTQNLVRGAQNQDDLVARGISQVGAWMSIMSLPNVPAGLSHALGHQLGAHCGVPHGVTSCILLPRVMDFNRPAVGPRQRLIAEAMGIDVAGLDDEAAGAAATARLREIVAELGVETRLREWNVSEEDLVAIAKVSVEDFMSVTNPRQVESEDEILGILQSVY
ncbi:MAG: iron-containing alcohol dehydrogenase [Actinobacteria bacterium]|nr:iron-containing alcohol dehydrogenase [Actinomycetota bacterium]